MATYFDINKVQVICSCGKQKPQSSVYYCRHCVQLKCSSCVTKEVDSFFCPTCLENNASSEAKMRKNRCASCFDCPCCGNFLSTRATVLLMSNPSDPNLSNTQKMYYMNCGFCRWTTRDAGIKDQKQPNGGWPSITNVHQERIVSLIENFHLMAVREKLEKEHKKYARKRNFGTYGDRYGLCYPTRGKLGTKEAKIPLKKQISWSLSFDEDIAGLSDGDKAKEPMIEPSVASDEVETLDEELFLKQKFSIEKVSTINQRLMLPELQPYLVSELIPRPKSLWIKQSLRCRMCDHNLMKPDYNAASTKFKINMSMLAHCPEIRISRVDNLAFGKASPLLLSVINPAVRQTNIKFGPISGEADTLSTAKLVTPEADIILAAKDATTDMYPDLSAGSPDTTFNDDPQIIASRQGNKVVVISSVTPMKSSGEVIASFNLTFTYQDPTTAAMSADKEKMVEMVVRFVLNIGCLAVEGS